MEVRKPLRDISNHTLGNIRKAPKQKPVLAKKQPTQPKKTVTFKENEVDFRVVEDEEFTNSADSLIEDLNKISDSLDSDDSINGDEDDTLTSDISILNSIYQQLEELNHKNIILAQVLEKEKDRNKELEEENAKFKEMITQKDDSTNTISQVSTSHHEFSDEEFLKSQETITELTAKVHELEQEKKTLKKKLETTASSKDSKLQQALEKKVSELEKDLQETNQKFIGSKDQLKSCEKTIVILEERLKSTCHQLEQSNEKYLAEKEFREQESNELSQIREEMTRMCEKLISEKHKNEENQKVIHDQEEVLKSLRELITSYEDSEKQMQLAIAEKENEVETVKSAMEDMKLTLFKDKQDLENTIQELKEEITKTNEEIDQRITMEKTLKVEMDELTVSHNELVEKVKKETNTVRELEATLNAKEKEVADAVEKKNQVVKKLEKEVKTNKKITEDCKKMEITFKRLSQLNQEFESKVSQKTKEIEKLNTRLAELSEELAQEKNIAERALKETEQVVENSKRIAHEKELLQQNYEQTSQVATLKYTNKLTMLEKKCAYLSKMCEYANMESNMEGRGTILRDLQDQLLEIMNNNEKLTEEFHRLEMTLVTKEKECKTLQEKLRQMEDLLSQQHKKAPVASSTTTTVTKDKKPITSQAENCLDELLIEAAVSGITPSQLTVREKAMITLQKMQAMKNLIERLEQEVREIKQNPSIVNNIDCTLHYIESHNVEDRGVVTLKLNELKTKLEILFGSVAQKEEFEERLKKSAEELQLIKEQVEQLTQSNQEKESLLVEGKDKVSKLEHDITNLKTQLSQTIQTCMDYKAIIKQFTELHNQQQLNKQHNESQNNESPVNTSRLSNRPSSTSKIRHHDVAPSSQQQQQENASYSTLYRMKRTSITPNTDKK